MYFSFVNEPFMVQVSRCGFYLGALHNGYTVSNNAMAKKKNRVNETRNCVNKENKEQG